MIWLGLMSPLTGANLGFQLCWMLEAAWILPLLICEELWDLGRPVDLVAGTPAFFTGRRLADEGGPGAWCCWKKKKKKKRWRPATKTMEESLKTDDSASINAPQFHVAVLGLPSYEVAVAQCLRFDRRERPDGVGKSTLCSRFVHPSRTDYAATDERHCSIVDESSFKSRPETLGSHCLYHGKVVKRPRSRPVVFHVVEHTTFFDSDGKVHPSEGEDEKNYIERATKRELKLPGKKSYWSMNAKKDSGKNAEIIPKLFQADGYVFVVDFTQDQKSVFVQMHLLDRLESMLRRSRGKPFVVALAKCDAVTAEQLANFKEEVKKHAPDAAVCYFSAREGVGVDAPFMRLFVEKSDGGDAPTHTPMPFEMARKARQHAEETARKDFREALEANLINFDSTLEEFVRRSRVTIGPSFAALLVLVNKEECAKLFRQRLVSLQVVKLKKTLRNAVDSHPDLKNFAEAAIRWVPGGVRVRLSAKKKCNELPVRIHTIKLCVKAAAYVQFFNFFWLLFKSTVCSRVTSESVKRVNVF